MDSLFMILLLIGLGAMIFYLVKGILKRGKGNFKKAGISLLIAVVSFIMFGIFSDPVPEEASTEDESTEITDEETNEPEEAESDDTAEEEAEETQEETNKSEEAEQNDTTKEAEETEDTDRKQVAEDNTQQFPADSVATFSGEQFMGMDYHYVGQSIGSAPAQTVGDEVQNSLLVENDRGYVMIVAPYYEIETEIEPGTEIEVYGHLNGNGYDISGVAPEAINSEAGLINAYEFYISGQQLGIDIF